MVSHKSLLAIILICLGIVWVAAAVKINQTRTPELKPVGVWGQIRNAMHIDPGFLEYAPPAPDTPAAPYKPQPTAGAYLVGNAKTGRVYLEKNSKKALPVASMSKLVTAFVATDVLSDSAVISVTEDSVKVPPDSSNLLPGEKFTLHEMLVPLLLNSSNVAAEAIASSTDNRTDFLESMSSYAWEIGMPGTYFADPSGISPYNAASARDLFALAQYLLGHRPDILEITRIASSTTATTTDHGSHVFSSTHPFVRDPGFIGGKTGRTPEAGETMMTIMNISGEPVAVIVLGSRYGARASDTALLLQEAAQIIDQ